MKVMLLLFFLMFGGFLVSNASLPVYISWLKYLSFFNFAVEVLAVNELSGVIVLFDPIGFVPIPLNGNEVLRNFGFDAVNYTRDFYCLLGLAGFWLILALVLLCVVVREKR